MAERRAADQNYAPLGTDVGPVDTNMRPPAKAVPEATAIAAVYLGAISAGRRPIEALMERFNVDRESAKAWPQIARDAGLLPPRGLPQMPVPADDMTHRLRDVG